MGTSNQPAKPAATGTAKSTAKPATQPAGQPVKQTEKPITNDTSTSTNSNEPKVQSITGTSENTGTESPKVVDDNLRKEGTVELTQSVNELFELKSKEADENNFRKESLQNEKKGMGELELTVSVPTAGRGVFFHFAPEDGICSNNQVDVLAAFVAKADGLKPSLAVFTLDSRDPIVLRKDIPHISIAPRDAEGIPIKPYWNWPIIVR